MRILLLSFVFIVGCVKEISPETGLRNDVLIPCPENVSCYSSYSRKDSKNWIEPMEVPEPGHFAMKKLESLARAKDAIVEEKKPRYMRAKFMLIPLINVPAIVEFFIAEDSKVMIKAQPGSSFPEFGLIKRLVEKIKFSYFQNDVN